MVKKHATFPVLVLGFIVSCGIVGPAFGHAAVSETYPADTATESVVDAITVTANEELLDLGGGAGFVFSVTDSDGHFYGDGCVIVDGTSATMPVRLGPAGEYTVAYRIVSADGHPIEGGWSFSYAPDANATTGEAFLELPVCGEERTPVVNETPEPAPTDEGIESAEPAETFDVIPFIGIATIPIIVGAIWVLMRSLGSRDSEDHLD